MKSCTLCKHAEWERTAAGRLHPSGDGICRYEYKLPPTPASMYWIGTVPKPYEEAINRRAELKEHCTYWARDERKGAA